METEKDDALVPDNDPIQELQQKADAITAWCLQCRTLSHTATALLDVVIFAAKTFEQDPKGFYEKGLPMINRIKENLEGRK